MGIERKSCCYDCLWGVKCTLRDICNAELHGCDYYTPLSLDKDMNDAQINEMHDQLKKEYEDEWREYIKCHTDPQYKW